MSQFMKSFASRDSGGGGGGSRRPLQTNLCIQISGSDLSAPNGGVVNGVVVAPGWLAGDQISVRLMNETESVATFRSKRSPAENRKFFDKSRPSIDKLMNGFRVGKNDITAMAEGGYLMMYGCTKDHDATVEGSPVVWKAQYAENFGNDPSRSVLHAMTRVTVVSPEQEGGKPYGYLDMLFPRDAQMIQSIGDLRAFYGQCMDGQLNGAEHNAQAAIRLIAGNDEVKTFYTYSARQEVQIPDGDGVRTIKVPASADHTWNEAVKDGVQARGALKMIAAALTGDLAGLAPDQVNAAKAIAADLASGAIKIEAIPGRRIPLVGDSLEWVMDADNKLSKAADKCLMKIDDGSPDGRVVPGYVGMTVGTMAMTPRAPGLPDPLIITKFAADEFAKARSVSMIPSENFKPAYARARDADAEQAAAAAAEQGGVQQSAFEDRSLDHEMEEHAGNDRGYDGPGR